MKHLLIFITLFQLPVTINNFGEFDDEYHQKENKFHLEIVIVGFGSNMFEMQPVFKVNGTKFVFTSEEVWIWPDQKKIPKDTLLIGNFRTSSIDSISNLIRESKDSVIFKSNIHIMSGAAAYITIEDGYKKISFSLHNTSDTTADKIVSILNSYIPVSLGKLYICCEDTKN